MALWHSSYSSILAQYPGLKLTLDISHWYCVSESFLEDQQDLLTELLDLVYHVHTRVGHTQGSQISMSVIHYLKDIVKQHLLFGNSIYLGKFNGVEQPLR